MTGPAIHCREPLALPDRSFSHLRMRPVPRILLAGDQEQHHDRRYTPCIPFINRLFKNISLFPAPAHPVTQQYKWRPLFPVSGRLHKPRPNRTIGQQDIRPPIPVSIRNIHRYPPAALRPRHTVGLESDTAHVFPAPSRFLTPSRFPAPSRFLTPSRFPAPSRVFKINKSLFRLTPVVCKISYSGNIQVPISIEVPGLRPVTAVDRKTIAGRKMHMPVIHKNIYAVIRR